MSVTRTCNYKYEKGATCKQKLVTQTACWRYSVKSYNEGWMLS